MVTINVTVGQNVKVIPLGRRGENEATQVAFDIASLIADYGEGRAELLAKRACDIAPYPIVVTQEGNKVTWTVSNIDTNYTGAGEVELFWYVGDTLAKSIVYKTFVLSDIVGASAAPDPYENWLETLTAIAAQVQDDAEDAADSKDAAALSASDASGSAADALESKNAASQSASDASGYANAALGYRNDAQQAKTDAVNAKDAAVSAKNDAVSAKSDAVAAKNTAVQAKDDAVLAKGAAQEAQRLAENAATQAQSILTSTIIIGSDGKFYIND